MSDAKIFNAKKTFHAKKLEKRNKTREMRKKNNGKFMRRHGLRYQGSMPAHVIHSFCRHYTGHMNIELL